MDIKIMWVIKAANQQNVDFSNNNRRPIDIQTGRPFKLIKFTKILVFTSQ